MEISEITIRLMVLSLPGVIAAIIINQLTVHKKSGGFQFIINSIILGFLSYFTYQLFLNLIAFLKKLCCGYLNFKKITFWDSLFNSNIPVSLNEVLIACVFSILIAFILSFLIQNKCLNKFAKKIKVSYKYGDDDLYTFFLNSKDVEWVWVRDEQNNYTYEGKIDSFSENELNRELVLIDVKVYPYESSKSLYEVPMMYLSFPKESTLNIEIPINNEELKNAKKSKRGSSKKHSKTGFSNTETTNSSTT